jgi:peptidoglycan/xylan/chitin deacetylase (PgdA/CDA1 family)
MTRSSRVDEDLEEPPLSEVLVLCYHAVSESWESELAVTPEQLERQVTILLERGYEPARFLDAVAAPPAPRTLAITFDDAYRSVYELARPVLQGLGATASVYAPTDWIGSERPMQWPGIDSWLGTPQEEELQPMGWGELGELCEAGWEVGSHTRSHPRLTELDDELLTAELEGSRLACAAGLDRPCETIAYPYGDVDDRVVAATAAAGYRAAGALPHAPHAAEALRWPRIGIYRWDGPTRFRLKVSPLVRRARGLPLRGLLDPVGRLTRTRAAR